MMRKQFKDIDIYAGIKAQDGAKWNRRELEDARAY